MEKKDKGEVTRRDFIKCVAIGGAILSVSGAVPKSLYAADKDQDDDCEFYIIDAHAHPDKWRSSDDSDSLVDIKELGMVASVFAAIGDAVYQSRANPIPIAGTNEFHYTINQLDYWLSGNTGSDGIPNGIVENGYVKLVLKSQDIPKCINKNNPVPGAILAIEGGDALMGKVRRVNEFYGLGVRLITIIHYRNSELGDTGSPHMNSATGKPDLDPGLYNGGLTDMGKKVIDRMRELGMIVDVAHANHDTLIDILDMKTGPVVDSHTSLYTETTGKEGRLRTWDEMEAIAKSGGVICNWPQSTANRNSFLEWANEIMEMKNNLGIEHVGIGTDGGGQLPSPVLGYHDVRDLSKLISTMQDIGFKKNEINLIMGGNFYRVFKQSVE